MGIDVEMAVALKKGETPEKLNARFRETHASQDSLVPKNEYLIGDLARKDYGACEYENTYYVNSDLARYYGKGYERGPALRIILQLEWLRAQPEVLEVYYGGDCGDGPSLWSEADSLELMKHFFKCGHAPYAQWHKASWEEPQHSTRESK